MELRTKLLLALTPPATLIVWAAAAFFFRPPQETAPILAGWALATANFTAAVAMNSAAMKKGFDAFKLILMAGMTLRIFIMLLFLMAVIRYLKAWTTPFSASLFLCFGIYIMIETGYFFLRSRKTKP